MQNDYNNGNNRTDVLAAAAAPFPSNSVAWYPEEYEEGINLRDYWYVLKKRKWWALGILAGAVMIAVLAIYSMKPVWQGNITLQITEDRSSASLGGAGMDPLGALMGSSDLDRFYETQYAILHSQALAYGLIDALKLQDRPDYKALVKSLPDAPPEYARQIYAHGLLGSLLIEPVKNSYLVNVGFRSTDKALAQEIPGAVQSVYLNLCMKTRQQSYVLLKEWLDKQLAQLGDKLEASEKASIASGAKGDFMGMDVSGGGGGAAIRARILRRTWSCRNTCRWLNFSRRRRVAWRAKKPSMTRWLKRAPMHRRS